MRPVHWMIALCALSWVVAAPLAGHRANPEMLFGMLGPLASAVATWIVVTRTYEADPARVTGVMIVGFVVKMLCFGVYVAVMLSPLGLRPMPFIVSFISYFIALHVLEALFLRRLFATPSRSLAR